MLGDRRSFVLGDRLYFVVSIGDRTGAGETGGKSHSFTT